MEIQLHNTTKVVFLNGIPARIWEGYTASGIAIHCFITRIGVLEGENQEEFEAELEATRPPTKEMDAIPTRLII